VRANTEQQVSRMKSEMKSDFQVQACHTVQDVGHLPCFRPPRPVVVVSSSLVFHPQLQSGYQRAWIETC